MADDQSSVASMPNIFGAPEAPPAEPAQSGTSSESTSSAAPAAAEPQQQQAAPAAPAAAPAPDRGGRPSAPESVASFPQQAAPAQQQQQQTAEPAAAAPAEGEGEQQQASSSASGGFVMPDALADLMEQLTPQQEPAAAAQAAPEQPEAAEETKPSDRFANDETRLIANFYQNGGTTEEYQAYNFARQAASMEPLDLAVAEILHNYPDATREQAIAGLERQLNVVLQERTVKGEDGTEKTVKPDPVSQHQLRLYADQARSRIAKNIEAFEQKASVSSTPTQEQTPVERQPAPPSQVASAGQGEVALRVAQQIVSSNRSLTFDYQLGDESLSLVGNIPDDQVAAFETSVADFIQRETQKLGGKITPSNLPEFQSSVQDFTRRFYTVLNPSFIRDIAASAYQAGAKNAVRSDKGVTGQLFRLGGRANGNSQGGVGAGSTSGDSKAKTQSQFWIDRAR